ncbi:glucan phosphoethanolaminetransferase (alkaline phosphatase superfamily) [Caulobacter ginsengisoli]|uniref:Glucan phosphoethanolaminetransferase (Alkaline phosphatase superfamily) n=1 Tax=Caulobacter ginsengisoli TaxID=400775 RepID=A0ABU0IT92_9CAUL|nr:hypothetical protein [Caulobacter ginsengisoli]MDQ0465216.1 glucan phosphoethanolaminetransferase (alkaline phosphatase superfamily) [Caulobacter ginsengisoli]
MARNNNGSAVAIVGGGLVAGAVDIAVATVIYHIPTWQKTLQAVARGWYGKASFEMGMQSVIVGALSQALICMIIAALYIQFAGSLLRRPWLGGTLLGIVVYLVMNYVVVPLSKAGGGWHMPKLDMNFVLTVLANILLGLIIAHFAARFAKR